MIQKPDISSRDIVLGQGLAPIPERLLLAHTRGEVLFIAGAGVSRDAGLPDFRDLVVKVYEELDPAVHSVISKKRVLLRIYDSQNREMYSVVSYNGQFPLGLNDWQKAEVKRFREGEYDVVLGMLERRLEGSENARSRVREEIGKILRPDGLKPAPIHRNLMRLADRGVAVAIITTNFDLLFEEAARKMKSPVQTYALGGIPRPMPTSNPEFNGVLHIHGALDRSPKKTSDLIISDRDFGEFYLRRRVVPDLIYDAVRLYHLVLVGYSANDSPMRYLLNAVAADAERFSDLKERFIFVGMSEDDPVGLEDWRARGITPIRYDVQDNDHSQLQRTLAQWVKFSKINENRYVDSVLKKIVKVKRTEARDEDRDLFDYFIRRSGTNERKRLSELLSQHRADTGWLDAIVAVSFEESRRATDETISS